MPSKICDCGRDMEACARISSLDGSQRFWFCRICKSTKPMTETDYMDLCGSWKHNCNVEMASDRLTKSNFNLEESPEDLSIK